MRATDSLPRLGSGAWGSGARLLDRVVALVGHLALGLALGLLLVRLMHSRRLHWSWALVGLGCVLVLRNTLDGASTTVLFVALLTVARRGAYRQREDLRLGADLASSAALRLTTLAAIARGLRAAGRMWTAALRTGGHAEDWWCSEDRLRVGHDERREPVAIPLGGVHGGTHTLVVGASGSGKTVTQTWIAVRAIERGMGVVVVDPKDDRDLRSALRDGARSVGRRFIEWTPNGPWIYNPYAQGGDTEIADKLLAGERFTEPHYLRQAQRYLGHEVRALRAAGTQCSLATLVRYLDTRELRVLARELPQEQQEVRLLCAYLDSLTPRQLTDLSGVRDRLAIMAESDVGRWLEPLAQEPACFDLLSAVRERAVVCFSLESDRRPLLTQMLGGAIVQDLLTTVAALQGSPLPTLAVIDEFSAVAAGQVTRLFGRARAAGMSLLLGTQELSDLRLPGREGLLDQVLGNLSTVIAHRQVAPASVDVLTQLAGTHGSWRTSVSDESQRSGRRFTRTRVYEPLLRAEALARLGRGQAAVMTLARGERVRIAQIYSNSARG
jgi:hypothetical protein